MSKISYITLSEMQQAASVATECVNLILRWLPVNGVETLSSAQTMADWHDLAPQVL